MSKSKTIIELNGKKYDANSGELIAHFQPPVVEPSVDGIRQVQSHKAHLVANHLKRRKGQKAQTLMRHAVKKPGNYKKVATGAVSTPLSSSDGLLNSEPPALNNKHDVRAARAHFVSKSSLVHRFANYKPDVVKKTAVLPVVKPAEPVRPVHSEAIKQSHHPPTKHDLFEQAVKHSISHQQAPVHHKKRRERAANKLGLSAKTLNVSAVALTVLILAGFIVYQNVPNMAMRVAASRAGFAARMPSYRPSGFGVVNPIHYQAGQITISFRSNADANRNFQITQRVSNWNSDALLANLVSKNSEPPQTIQDKGRTIFIYNDSNATWVDGGIWYSVEGNADLTTDQLVRIASSI